MTLVRSSSLEQECKYIFEGQNTVRQLYMHIHSVNFMKKYIFIFVITDLGEIPEGVNNSIIMQ